MIAASDHVLPNTARSEPGAFLWNSFAKCSVSNRYAMGLEIIREALLSVWANLRQRALGVAIAGRRSMRRLI